MAIMMYLKKIDNVKTNLDGYLSKPQKPQSTYSSLDMMSFATFNQKVLFSNQTLFMAAVETIYLKSIL